MANGRSCTSCNVFKEWEQFTKSARRRSGYNNMCKECTRAHGKRYRIANREKELERCRKKYHKTKYTIRKVWEEKNKEEIRARKAQRKKRVKMATPAWADLEAIKKFYKECPEGYHVDHIVPLKGKNICGLHVLRNLQYLSIYDNLSKGNKCPDNVTEITCEIRRAV